MIRCRQRSRRKRCERALEAADLDGQGIEMRADVRLDLCLVGCVVECCHHHIVGVLGAVLRPLVRGVGQH